MVIVAVSPPLRLLRGGLFARVIRPAGPVRNGSWRTRLPPTLCSCRRSQWLRHFWPIEKPP
eukprot:2289026-Pyramimonas_sp.AAC.1